MLLPFFVRTALIYQLGVQYVGLNSFYISILNMLSLAELGFGTAIAYCMYEPIAKEDHETVARLLSYFRKVYRVIGILIFAIGLIVMPFLGYLITGEQPADVNLQLGFLIYLINTSISYLMFGYRQTLLVAHQREDISSKIIGAMLIALNVAQVVTLIVFPSFYVFLILMPIFTVIQNVALYIASNKLFPQYKHFSYLKSGLSKQESKFIRQRVIGVFVYRTCTVTRDSCDTVFISLFLGLSIAGLYSNYFVITSSVLIMIEVVCNSMTASVGHSIVSESKEKNFADMRLFMFFYASIAAVSLACVLCLYQPFMELWVGPDLMLPNEIVWLLCAYFYMRVMGDIRSVYVNAAGLWWKLKGRSIIEAVMNIVLNFALIQIIGLPGVIIATIISMLLINYLWGSEVIFTNYFQNKKLHVFFLDNLIYLLVTIVACTIPYFILSLIVVPLVSKLAIGAALALGLSSAIWLLFFSRSKRLRAAFEFVKMLKN